MKIVVYSPTFYPVRDGTSIQAKRLSDLLSQKYKVYRLTFAVNRDIKRYDDFMAINDGVQRVIPTYKDDKNFPTLDGRDILLQLKNIKPDVIHIRGWYQLSVVESIIEEYSRQRTKIFWHTDGLVECHNFFSEERDYQEVIQKAIDYGVFFICHSSYERDMLLSLGIEPERSIEIPSIIGCEIKRQQKDWDKPRLLSLGRFFHYKGHETVYKASKLVDQNLEIILAGAADSEDSRVIIAKLNKQNASLMLNPSDIMVVGLYNLSTHFISASTKETLGITTLEAIYAGCIPLVRRIGGIVSFLKEDFLFDDDEELIDKIKYMILPKNALSLDEMLYLVRDKFSPEKIKLELDKLYRGLL